MLESHIVKFSNLFEFLGNLDAEIKKLNSNAKSDFVSYIKSVEKIDYSPSVGEENLYLVSIVHQRK